MWIMAWRRANTDPEESRRGTVTVTKVAKTVVGTRLWQWKQQGRESRVPWRSGLNDMWTVEQNRRKNEKIQVWRLWNNEPSAWLPFPEQPFSRDQLCIAFCYRSVPKSCPTLCNLMDCNMPGFPVPHYLTEFSQTHVHWVSDAIHLSLSLPPHGLQHARLPCPSPSPGVYPSPCPLNQWCYPTISSSISFFSCLQSFLASGSFPISQLLASDGQSIGASASVSVFQRAFRVDFL